MSDKGSIPEITRDRISSKQFVSVFLLGSCVYVDSSSIFEYFHASKLDTQAVIAIEYNFDA